MKRNERKSHHLHRETSDRGAAAVEFALVSVLLFTILFGILQYAIYFWALQSGSHAAREAARQAAVGNLNCTQFDALVLANAQGEIVSTVNATRSFYTDATMATSVDPGVVGGVVKVTVSFNSIDLNFPFVPFLNNGAITEQAVSRVEHTANSSSCP